MKLFKPPKKPTYLGNVLIVPRSQYQLLSDWDFSPSETDQKLIEGIRQSIGLPEANLGTDPDHYLLDIVVMQYKKGLLLPAELTLLSVFTRPSVRMRARLRNQKDGKTVATVDSKRAIPRRVWMKALFEPRSWFKVRKEPEFSKIVNEALLELVSKLLNKLK